MQKLDPGTGPNLGASQAGGESLRLRHRRTLASAALGTTASSIWRTQQIKKEKKRQKEKERKPARPVVVAVAVAVSEAAATAAATAEIGRAHV